MSPVLSLNSDDYKRAVRLLEEGLKSDDVAVHALPRWNSLDRMKEDALIFDMLSLAPAEQVDTLDSSTI